MSPGKKKVQLSIADLLKTSAGRSKLAMAMTAPLMNRRNYAGIARRAFSTQYRCCVCNDYEEEYYVFNKNFDSVNKKDYDENKHLIACVDCRADTSEELFKLSKKKLIDMPLYINSKNPFVAYAAKERLKFGV